MASAVFCGVSFAPPIELVLVWLTADFAKGFAGSLAAFFRAACILRFTIEQTLAAGWGVIRGIDAFSAAEFVSVCALDGFASSLGAVNFFAVWNGDGGAERAVVSAVFKAVFFARTVVSVFVCIAGKGRAAFFFAVIVFKNKARLTNCDRTSAAYAFDFCTVTIILDMTD